MAADIQRLRAKLRSLEADRSEVEEVWDEIETYVMPLSGRTARSANEKTPQRVSLKVWDLTAPLACEHLAASLHGNVTSPAARWIDFEWSDPELENDQEAVRHREALALAVWNELQASDFNSEISAAYLEYAGIGNLVLLVEAAESETWEGLDFTGVPCREAFIERDSRGRIHNFFRKLRWTPIQILERFGANGVPEKIRELAKNPEAGIHPLDVGFCIFRRDEIPVSDGLKQIAADLRPYGFVYFLTEGGELLGEEGGYHEMRAVHAPWGRNPGQVWGFGRGHMALLNAKFLNAFKETARASAAKAVDPSVMTTERGILSDLSHEPGGVTVVGNPEDVQILESKGRFDVSRDVLQDERIEIRRCFHEDDLQLKESPQMTATEVAARRDMMDRVLGSPVGRLQADALAPIVMIVLRMLYRAGRLPEDPDSVKKRKATLKVRFRGQIARAQMMDEVAGIEREAGFVATLEKEGFAKAKYWFDEGMAIKEHAKRVGAPATTIRSDAEAKKLMDADEQMQRAMAQAEIAKTQSEAARNNAQAMPPEAAAPAGAAGAFGIAPQPAMVPSGGLLP